MLKVIYAPEKSVAISCIPLWTDYWDIWLDYDSGSGHCSIDQILNLSELREALNKPFLQVLCAWAALWSLIEVFNLFNNYEYQEKPPAYSKEHYAEYCKYQYKVYFLYWITFLHSYTGLLNTKSNAPEIFLLLFATGCLWRVFDKQFWRWRLRSWRVPRENLRSPWKQPNLLTPSAVFVLLQSITRKCSPIHFMICHAFNLSLNKKHRKIATIKLHLLDPLIHLVATLRVARNMDLLADLLATPSLKLGLDLPRSTKLMSTNVWSLRFE